MSQLDLTKITLKIREVFLKVLMIKAVSRSVPFTSSSFMAS